MRTTILALSLMMAVTGAAQAQMQKAMPDAAARTGEGNRPECTATFRQLDQNRDGRLTGGEISNATLPASIARNPDGSIGEVDFVSACSKQEPLGRSSQ